MFLGQENKRESILATKDNFSNPSNCFKPLLMEFSSIHSTLFIIHTLFLKVCYILMLI